MLATQFKIKRSNCKEIVYCGEGKSATNCSACMRQEDTDSTSWCNSIDCYIDANNNKCLRNGNLAINRFFKFLIFCVFIYKICISFN